MPDPKNKSLAKGISVLELLCEHQELTVSELANKLSLNRITAHRYLSALRDLGYVKMTPKETFCLSKHMIALSSAHGETINLGHWIGGNLMLIDKLESQEILRLNAPLGVVLPAYCTASGKAILAFLPKDEVEEYLSIVSTERYGPNTIVSVPQLRKELLL